MPAAPKTARDSDTAAWVSAGLEERQSEDQAARRTSTEVCIGATTLSSELLKAGWGLLQCHMGVGRPAGAPL